MRERSLTILADGAPVSGFRHARLTGRDALGLLPLPFTLRVWNLSEDGYYTLRSAKQISVRHGDSVLAAGKVSDVYRHMVPEGTVTEAVFSPGLELWEARVSLSVEAGTKVSETVRRILAASGIGIPLLSFPGKDPVRSRSQAFFGRAAECVLEALSAVQAKCCLLSLNSMIFPYYLAMTLNSPHCYQLSQEYTHGTGNHDLGLTRMVKITLPLPPLAEQKRIVSKLEEILPLCDKLKS